jgi:hypothetical protein
MPFSTDEDAPSPDDVVAYIPDNRTGDGIDLNIEAVDYDPTATPRLARCVAKLEGLIVEWEDGYQRCDEAVDDMLVAEAARITKRRVK